MTQSANGKPNMLPQLQRLNSVFTPAAPIEKRDFFSGRVAQVQQVFEAAVEHGRHAVLYGERGVGKTSLANIIDELLPEQHVIKVSADTSDDFDTLFRKVFRRIELTQAQRSIGYVGGEEYVFVPAAALLPQDRQLLPDDVTSMFSQLGQPMILIVDEFDRTVDESTKTLMADTIKALSDSLPIITFVVVGVAQTVGDLIGEHPSIERNIRQVKLPRMSPDELREIVDKGLGVLGMDIVADVTKRITHLSQGFPHYTHLLGKYSAKQALLHDRNTIDGPDFEVAIVQAVEDTHESIQAAYYRATIATRKTTLFPKVLLAAAMAAEDEFGTFRATDLLEPLGTITGRDYLVPHFAYHLGKLCSDERGMIFTKIGTPKRYRYRFSNPLMKPFILMQGYTQGTVDVSLFNSK